MAPVTRTSGSSTSATSATSGVTKAQTPEELRAQIAQWAIDQAKNPNARYSQGPNRFGSTVNGKTYFDCSGLVFSAYKQFGITLGGNWTGAMMDTWKSWATQVPKDTSKMQPGDLVLIHQPSPGEQHVLMYIGDGKCVAAKTDHLPPGQQLGFDTASSYFNMADCVVIRPNVSQAQVNAAPAHPSLQSVAGLQAGNGGGGGSGSGVSSSGGSSGSGGVGGSGDSSSLTSTIDGDPTDATSDPTFAASYANLLQALSDVAQDESPDNQKKVQDQLRKLFPKLSSQQLQVLAGLLEKDPGLAKAMKANPDIGKAINQNPGLVAKLASHPELVKAFESPEIQSALAKNKLGASGINTLLNFFADKYEEAGDKGAVDLKADQATPPADITAYDAQLMAEIKQLMPPSAA